MGRKRIPEVVDPTAMAALWLNVRQQYWAQWDVDATYTEAEQAEVLKVITRHHRNPAICAARMEKLTLRLDGPYIAQIRKAA